MLRMTSYLNTQTSPNPQVSVITPDVFTESYLNGTLPVFDAMATFSSLEHSGLGRYGDGIHPWADLVTMARAQCVTKPGAMVLVGVPVSPKDTIHFNMNRYRSVFSKMYTTSTVKNTRKH